jgi:CheY-like chemotaxis protein
MPRDADALLALLLCSSRSPIRRWRSPMVRILIVDDDSFCRTLLRKTLGRLPGTKIMEAENGAEAIAVAQEGKLDLILLDIMMPVMDGIEFLKHSATDENLSSVPVVMITALTERESVVASASYGARDYITKPFNPITVRVRIQKLLAECGAG